MHEPRWRQEGTDPDYRFSLANERTYLAWIRTALALLASGVALDQFAARLGPATGVPMLAIGLCGCGALLCAMAYYRWRANEMAMRHGRRLPLTRMMPVLSAVLLVAGALVGSWVFLK